MAFSVDGAGSLILTARADGSILDQQINLSTLKVHSATAEPNYRFDGEPNAVINSTTGVVTIFGIDRNGEIG